MVTTRSASLNSPAGIPRRSILHSQVSERAQHIHRLRAHHALHAERLSLAGLAQHLASVGLESGSGARDANPPPVYSPRQGVSASDGATGLWNAFVAYVTQLDRICGRIYKIAFEDPIFRRLCKTLIETRPRKGEQQPVSNTVLGYFVSSLILPPCPSEGASGRQTELYCFQTVTVKVLQPVIVGEGLDRCGPIKLQGPCR